MFGKINFALNKSQSQLQNKLIQPPKQNYQKTINTHTNDNSVKPNIQGNKNFSNPLFSSLNKKSNLKNNNNYEEKSQDFQNINKTKKIKKVETHLQNKKTNFKANRIQTLQSQMQGSKFRILNQLLYTTSSQQAMKHFEENPQDYQTYHDGYRFQSQKWESKPVNVLIKYFRKQFKNYKDKIICDLGCGEGFLYEGLTKQTFSKEDQEGKVNEVKNKHIFKSSNILSFDLVALKPFIKVADIKNLPLQKQSVDVSVFCLSLMGKNYLDFIKQAHRLLRKGTGELIISQVESRSKDWKSFVQMIEMIGFRLVNNGVNLGPKLQKSEGKKVGDNKGKYFRMLHFIKCGADDETVTKVRYDGRNYKREQLKQLSELLLTQCIYKRR